MPPLKVRWPIVVAAAIGPLFAALAPGEVTTVTWEDGRPRRWIERTVSSPHRVEVRLPPPPSGHEFVTVVVENQEGRRVRNLLGQAPVASLPGGPESPTVAWDGLDDAGAVVPAGTYRVRGLSIPRPRILLDYAFYTPNPLPWQGYSRSAWAADHTGPSDLACAPEGSTKRTDVAIACTVAETPHAVLGLDDQGTKLWGFKREGGINGIRGIAFADGILWMGFKDTIVKVDADSQADIGWKRPAGKSTALTVPGEVRRVAVGPKLGAALVRTKDGAAVAEDAGNTVVFFEKESGTSRRSRGFPGEAKLPWAAHDLAFLADGRLLVSGDAGVHVVSPTGETAAYATPGCERPRALAVDSADRLFVFDAGADRQVKVYGPDHALERTIGRRGGQTVEPYVRFTEVVTDSPAGLAIDYDAFRGVGGIDVDRRGNLWAADPVHPRMVTVWDATGKRIRTFVGNTEYAATGCSLHEQDPKLAYGYGLIFPIDSGRIVPHDPSRFASSTVRAEPAAQRLPRYAPAQVFTSGRLFRSAASGRVREYLIHNDFGYPVLCVARDGDYRPCAAAVVIAGRKAGPQFAKPNPPSGSGDWHGIWSDHNADELVQPEEVFPLPERGGRITDFYGMGYVFNPQLTWYLGGHAAAPARFLDDGTPVFDASSIRKLRDGHLAVRTGDFLVGDRSEPFLAGEYRFADLEGNVFATYPLAAMGVHASMRAPAPRAGETRGELCYAGAATVPGELGPVVASQGNMGQAFVFTGDGLFVCSLFKDVRHGPRAWPPEAAKGTDFTDCTMGQEPFNGCVVVQDDGRMRMVFGRSEAVVCVVEGLEKARRFGPVTVQFDPAASAASARPQEVATAEAAALRIPRVADAAAAAITVDGNLGDWPEVPKRTIRAGEKPLADVRLAHTGSRLLVGVEVRDETPMVNGLADWRSAFRTGDAVDIALGPGGERPDAPVAGDVRLLLVPGGKAAVAVRYRPVVPGTAEEQRVPFTSPICTTLIDEVAMVKEADVVFTKTADGYVCEAAVPLEAFGSVAKAGPKLLGDVGILSSDGGGQQTVARNYLFNHTWTMTADLCSEAMLKPDTWGQVVFE